MPREIITLCTEYVPLYSRNVPVFFGLARHCARRDVPVFLIWNNPTDRVLVFSGRENYTRTVFQYFSECSTISVGQDQDYYVPLIHIVANAIIQRFSTV